MNIKEHELETQFETLCGAALYEACKYMEGCPDERRHHKWCTEKNIDCKVCWFYTLLERMENKWIKKT